MKESRLFVHNQDGQSLVELIIALGVILMVLLSLASIGLVSVKNSDMAKTKSLATSYAREGMEYARKFRDSSTITWTVFKNNCGGGFQAVLNLAAIPSPFTRTITCSYDAGTDKCTVRSIVSWTDDKGVHSSDIISNFTDKGSWQ